MQYLLRSALYTLALCGVTCAVAAEDVPPPASGALPATESAADANKPSFLSEKRRISKRDLKNKVRGFYVNGLPIIDADPDAGVGFGAVGNVFWDGQRGDPFFAYTPYRHRIGAQIFATTNGLQQHIVDYDAPYIFDSPFRLRANIMYERNTSANYFGRGNASMGGLTYTGAGHSFATIDDYREGLRVLGADGLVHTHYNKYDIEDPGVRASLERVFFQGFLRAQLGIGLSYVRIRDYAGKRVEGDDLATGRHDIEATEAATHLREDCQAQRIVGCSGGLHNTVKASLAFDTRDYEPDPNSGVFVDLAGEFSSRAFGSDFDYARVTFAARGYYSPFPELTDLVVAARGVYSVQSAGTPFFAMNTIAFSDIPRQGLGGLWTLRGYHQDRFVGPVAALGSLELRWTFYAFDFVDQHIALGLVPYLDLGRVFDRMSDFSMKRWRAGTGGAFHIAWNDATIINITVGTSSEGTELYMDLGQQF